MWFGSVVQRSIGLSALCMGLLLNATVGIAKIDPAITQLQATGKAFASIAQLASPAVVYIRSDSQETEAEESADYLMDELFKRFHEQSPKSRKPKYSAEGSGFIFSQAGHIITNNHLVQNATKIRVTLMDGKEFDATIVGTDPQSDLAVIQITGQKFPSLSLGDSEKLDVGEWVVALGNPFGLSHSLSVGVVSAKSRSRVGIADYENFIQTDAAINPGNSGGPLLNLSGHVVGINTAIVSRSGGYMGIGFAIPINMAKSIVQQLIERGGVTRGYLGVRIQELTTELAKGFHVNTNHGVLVAQVDLDSPAYLAEIQQGDVIISLDKQPVKDVGSFRNKVSMEKPGSHHVVTVMRQGAPKELDFIIGSLPETAKKSDQDEQTIDSLGASFKLPTPEVVVQLGLSNHQGVMIHKVRPNSIAEQSGLRAGSVILEVNHQAMHSVAQLQQTLGMVQQDAQHVLLITDQYGQRYAMLQQEG